ncbi:MoxR protein [Vibrio sp. 10N.286.49.B3]|uniref:DUF58 domain-containing protein n=1 Tax=Vibrio sp. 10N.286.49.B3 TaxID=1880855 RepID=UPI000C82612F|nr:DUF58 domain-containing protein [Vibrio sp. 10N.286.49.B3]PMH42217.1 MoxR protein [Vibrio sp. 10N.286.49.B3]
MKTTSISDKNVELDSRLHLDYKRLVKLQLQANKVSLLPKIKANTTMSGRHRSHFRGRGLNFEELRHYQVGDDIRNFDWKVTKRTGKPHVRSYTEEKDRNIIVCVDQRSSMFFSSVDTMKSVVAGDIAAIAAWCSLNDNDRVGLSIAAHTQIHTRKPQRSPHQLLGQLRQLAEINQSLSAYSSDSSSVRFADWIRSLLRLNLRGATLIMISDWHDCSAAQLQQLIQLQQSNDLLAVVITDPLEHALPAPLSQDSWVLSDGTYQLSIDKRNQVERINTSLISRQAEQRVKLEKLMAVKTLPYVEITTSGDHIQQFIRAVGGR